mmetsp:Transcript_20756/g.29755  ORF Transcript_20756/g.29755 Transcript_20756/m.29755 type:complete len:304 (-) Transcript_20756:1438-2349(-)
MKVVAKNPSRIISGHGIEDNIDIGLERSDKLLFGRAYLFGKAQEEKVKKARFFSIEDDVTPEGLERYYKLHPFIKEEKLSSPCKFRGINGLTAEISPSVLVCPDSVKIPPFEIGKKARLSNAKKYVQNLRLHDEKIAELISNRKKVLTDSPPSDNSPATTRSNSSFDIGDDDELQNLLDSFSLSNSKKTLVDIEKSPLTMNLKKQNNSEKHTSAIEINTNDVKLTPERDMTLDEIHSFLLKGTRKFMKFDHRSDIHQCDYSSDGEVKSRKTILYDDFDVHDINERIRQRRQLSILNQQYVNDE